MELSKIEDFMNMDKTFSAGYLDFLVLLKAPGSDVFR